MREVKLKPCPFCGGKANKRIEFPLDADGLEVNMYIVGCNNCDVEFTCLWDEEIVVNAWNTRKPMDDIIHNLEHHKSYNQMMLKKFPKMGTIENAIYKTQRDTYENAIEIVKGGVED